MGRKPKKLNEKRTRIIAVRVNLAEEKLLASAARQLSQPTAVFVRSVALSAARGQLSGGAAINAVRALR